MMKLTKKSLEKAFDLAETYIRSECEDTYFDPDFVAALVLAHIEALECLKLYEHISAQPDSEVTRFSAASEFLNKHGGVE